MVTFKNDFVSIFMVFFWCLSTDAAFIKNREQVSFLSSIENSIGNPKLYPLSKVYRAGRVLVDGNEVKPHTISMRREGNLMMAFDDNLSLIFAKGDGHDFISNGKGSLVDLADDEQYGKLTGDAVAIDLQLNERMDTVSHQNNLCGPQETPRYLHVHINADSSFCSFYNGPLLAEERALFFLAETDAAFADVSCLRVHLASFSINCDPTSDIYTTELEGINGTDILWKYRDLKQLSSPNSISILLQGKDDGTNTLGAAFVATACRTDYAFGWVEGGLLGAQIMAHEIGHLVSLRHSSSGIMTSSLGSNSIIEFSQESVHQLTEFMSGTLSQCVLPNKEFTVTQTPITSPTPTTSKSPTSTPTSTQSSTAAVSPSSIPTFIPEPTFSFTPKPTTIVDLCHNVREDKYQPGCTRSMKIGQLPVEKNELPKMIAFLKLKQSCDSNLIFKVQVQRRNVYKMKSVTLSYSFSNSPDERTLMKEAQGDSPKGLAMLFNLNDLKMPVDSSTCCGVNAALSLKIKIEFQYKVREDGVKNKFWKFSEDTFHVEDLYKHEVICGKAKNNKCRQKRCDKDFRNLSLLQS